MTKEEIIEMARQAGFVDYELDDGTTNAFDKRYEDFAKLVMNHYSYTHAHLWLTRIEGAVKAEREEVTKERDRMCEHCKWRNDENSTLDETNQSKVLGKS